MQSVWVALNVWKFLGDKSITFEDNTKELFNEVRRLYMSGAKNGNDDDYQKFMT